MNLSLFAAIAGIAATGKPLKRVHMAAEHGRRRRERKEILASQARWIPRRGPDGIWRLATAK
jgi:hypothetical protein